jgi:TetR/AcrR family transcriptional regulator
VQYEFKEHFLQESLLLECSRSISDSNTSRQLFSKVLQWAPGINHGGKMNEPKPKGRPFKTEAEQEEVRGRILDATAAAYAETGYHGLSVQAILDKAEISRPTFYRYFSNVDEPAKLMIVRAHKSLGDRLANEVPTDASLEERMSIAMDVYLDWGRCIGPLVRPFYIELHDPYSPVSVLRQDILARIGRMYIKVIEQYGRRVKNQLLVDMMQTGNEFLGYRFHIETNRDADALAVTRDAMIRLMASTFPDPEEWLKHFTQDGQLKARR